MRITYRVVSVAAAVVLACLAPVAPATAATALACGTTNGQWTGTFKGTLYNHEFDTTYPLRTVIRLGGPAGLTVDTYYDGNFYDGIDDQTKREQGKLYWVARVPQDFSQFYDTQNVTCLDGRVQRFSGFEWQAWAGPGFYLHGDFKLARI